MAPARSGHKLPDRVKSTGPSSRHVVMPMATRVAESKYQPRSQTVISFSPRLAQAKYGMSVAVAGSRLTGAYTA